VHVGLVAAYVAFGMIPVVAIIAYVAPLPVLVRKWWSDPDVPWFSTAKRALVLPVMPVLIWLRHGYTGELGLGLQWLVWGLLAANMGVAVLTQVSRRRWSGAFVGTLLVLAMPAAESAAKIGEDVVYATGWAWIVAYTLWDLRFMADRHPERVLVAVGLLTAPLTVAAFAGPDLWLQSRTYTLGLHLIATWLVPGVVSRLWLPDSGPSRPPG
jgi:hypothetical protein